MILKQITEISIRIEKPSRTLTMNFVAPPTQEGFILAVQNIVSEMEFEEYIKYMLVEAARSIGLPETGTIRKGKVKNPTNNRSINVKIYHDKGFLFDRLV